MMEINSSVILSVVTFSLSYDKVTFGHISFVLYRITERGENTNYLPSVL